MNLKEYQDAAFKTILPTERNWEYVTNNLLAETHKFAAKVYESKSTGTEDNKDPDIEALALKIGDIAWYVAVGLRMSLIDEDMMMPEMQRKLVQLEWFADDLVEVTQNVYQCSQQDELFGYRVFILKDAWRLIASSVQPLLGISFNEVLQMNLDKLAARQAKSTIGGSGDNR